MQLLKNHKTIRKYQDKDIPDEILENILESGVRASTTGNMQVYSIIITRDQDMKDKLAPLHFNQSMVKEAPLTLTFCADFNRFNKWCRQSNAKPGYNNFLSFMTGAIDSLLVAQNVCIAAEDEGLGICYLGTTIYMADKIIELLKLPDGVVPVTTVTLGYPAEDLPQADRLGLDAVVHMETYADYSPEEIENYYSYKENLKENKEFVKENNKQSLAQVFTDIRYKKKDNELFSLKLLEVLKKQGFMDHD